MIDPRLETEFRKFDRYAVHARLRRKWAICGVAATIAELILFVIRLATGWKTQAVWFGILAAGALAAWMVWLWEKNKALNYPELVESVAGSDSKTRTLLTTALELKPDVTTGRLSFLQSRVIDEIVQHPDKDLWIMGLRKQADRARNLQIIAIFCLVSVLFLSVQPPSKRLKKVTSWFGPEITVTPGDSDVERGNGLVVTARFGQEAPPEADLIFLSANGVEKRIPLARHLEDPVFGTSLPEITEDALYRVEYGNKKTRDFKIKVFEYPSLTRADASLAYPAYTGLTNRIIKDTVRISAVEGTKVTYNLELNKNVVKASLISKEQILSLAVQTNAVAILDHYSLTNSGRFMLELVDADGRTNKASTEFVFQALPNKPAEIKLSFPTGDQRVSKLEEFQLTSEAKDDFGVLKYGIGYGPASEEPKYIELGGNVPANEKKQFTHQISFEQLGVDIDQVVSYFAWADDYGPDGNVRRTYTDMFFAEVRPFDEIYRKDDSGVRAGSQEQQQGQQGGQNGSPKVKLAELQKQIVIATWKLQREKGGPVKGPIK